MGQAVKPQTQTKTCPKHGDYEVVGIDFGFGNGVQFVGACPKCSEEHDVERARILEQTKRWEREKRIDALRAAAGVPERFTNRTLDNFRAELPGQQKALSVCRRFLDTDKRGVSLIFSGKPGTGKTHLACGIASELVNRGRLVMFRTVRQAIRHVKETYSRDSAISEAEAIQALCEADLLILDEVGVQVGSEHELMLLFEIINERYQAMRSTILLTNLTGSELVGYLGERVIDRFREDGAVVAFDWESQRGRA